jgi:hypothetical protein
MMPSDTLQHYARHDLLTHPAGLASLYDALPAAAPALCDVMSGLIIHTSWADKYGIPSGTPLPRETKPVADRLAEIQQRFGGSLIAHRAPTQRPFGTCRDFALLMCSALRHRAIPARVRCGFATYFAGRRYADHWICEYWIAEQQRWAAADAQIDALQREHLAIGFDTADLPNGAFVSAPEAWALAQSGDVSSDDFGHGEANGLWFLSLNLHRDLLALASRHVSAWDSWRSADDESKRLSHDDLVACDRLAADVIAAVASGNVAALEELAKDRSTPPWHLSSHSRMEGRAH